MHMMFRFLEMTEDHKGHVGCAVHNTAQSPKVIFTKASVRLESVVANGRC